MRFLKNKIALANAARARNIKEKPLDISSALKFEGEVKMEIADKFKYTQAKLEHYQDMAEASTSGSESSPSNNKKVKMLFPNQKTNQITRQKFASKTPRATKNIVKNYSQAICKFALSPMATDYLLKFTKTEGVSPINFLNYVRSVKTQLESLHHFRSILLITDTDSYEIAGYKRVIAQISKIFVKFFSVNWIYHSKLVHKEAHLMYRHKMLRRIVNPELFTYLKI